MSAAWSLLIVEALTPFHAYATPTVTSDSPMLNSEGPANLSIGFAALAVNR